MQASGTGSDTEAPPRPPAEPHAAHSFRADKVYMPSLDGMRALSIALVVASHFWADGIVPGGFGVTVFFFISGFLITRLLLAEYATHRRISIPRFYVRRFLRLYPALIALLLVLAVVYYVMRGRVPVMELVAGAFYFMNYYSIVDPTIELPIRMLWSLAIEEHYYLAFPLLFALMAPWTWRFLGVLAGVAAAVLAWRLFLVFGMGIDVDPPSPALPYPYIATDCRIDSILFGAILALLVQVEVGASWARRIMRWPVFVVCTVLLMAVLLPRSPEFRETLRYSLQGLLLLPLVACCAFGEQFGVLRRVLENPALVWVGKVSYSIYLWHFGIVRLVKWQFPDASVLEQVAIGLPVILLAASASYYLVERPFRSLRASWHALPASPARRAEAEA